MEADVTKAIADLDKRISYQESIHSNKTLTPEGIVTSVATNWTLIILTVAFSTIITIGIVNYVKNKNN